MSVQISKCPLPTNSHISTALDRVDYADAYASAFSAKKALSIEDVARAFFSASPKWISLLFRLRNELVRVLGLKTPHGKPPTELQDSDFEKGKTLGLFKILDKNQREILCGEDDWHLNFRASFFLERNSGENPFQYNLIFSTTVKFHGLFGRLYFLPVKPLHKLIVRAMIRKIVSKVT